MNIPIGQEVSGLRTYYEVLGVAPDVTQDDLRAAYRKRSRECHPDAGGSNEAMKELNVAWETLRDPLRRAAYDRELSGRQKGTADQGPSVEPLTMDIIDALGQDRAVAVFAELFAALGYRVIPAQPGQRGFHLVIQRSGATAKAVLICILAQGNLVDARQVLRCATDAEQASYVPWIITNREFSQGAYASATELNVLMTGRGELESTLVAIFGSQAAASAAPPREADPVKSQVQPRFRIRWGWVAISVVLLIRLAAAVAPNEPGGRVPSQSVSTSNPFATTTPAPSTKVGTSQTPTPIAGPAISIPAPMGTTSRAPATQPQSQVAAPEDAVVRDASIDPNTSASAFTLGSTRDQVRAIMGTPNSQIGDAWQYEYSLVYFDSAGRVRGWADISDNLRVDIGKRIDGAPPFTLGSPKAAVLRAMGTPSALNGDTWQYGYSLVYFDGRGQVRGWADISRNLRVFLGDREPSAPGIIEGSSKADVLSAMGTPSAVNGDTWQYGYSLVYFDSAGRVRGWADIGRNLKLQ